MCGIFGIISPSSVDLKKLKKLSLHAKQRGQDSSGLIFQIGEHYQIQRANNNILRLLSSQKFDETKIVFGHSRLITNGLEDNQPLYRDGLCLFHNGIVTNDSEIWNKLKLKRKQKIDSEVILAIVLENLASGKSLNDGIEAVFSECNGAISCALLAPQLGKVALFSNVGSLYTGTIDSSTYVASEKFPLDEIGCKNVHQILKTPVIFDIATGDVNEVAEVSKRSENLIPTFSVVHGQDKLLLYPKFEHKRCAKCILPETMPFISFDEKGICNYCANYKSRNKPKPRDELFELVEAYRRVQGPECILPFSGGRDSCYGLHLVVNELDMKPITYTYDWGMVTDLGRRNISRMCAKLGVENIIIADDISRKRKNIAQNLNAWLKSPHLGMVSILTAGDKHFFRHVETVKKQTGVTLNLWGVNPLEVTHFKSGFLGIKPDFEEKKVYASGISKQLKYHWKRLKAMSESSGYFNRSLFDTLSGEYYRSFTKKSDYFHIFDFWRWDEKVIDQTLSTYDWERAPDTKTTWRIGDGTAAFYNYIYRTIVGFTEHDTFRSNQIREGEISREHALEKIDDENQPRYLNIKWYLDAISMDFEETIGKVNEFAKKENPHSNLDNT